MDGVVLGAIAEEVLRKILETKDQIVNFKDDLEQLQNTLEHVHPLFKEGSKVILKSNDHTKAALDKVIDKLEKGKLLIEKCHKVGKYNVFKKILYSSKIKSLDDFVQKFCQRELPVEIWLGNKQIESNVQQLVNKMKVLELALAQRQIVGLSPLGNEGLLMVPELPLSVVGFKLPLDELKRELLKEDVRVVGVFAPGGCGKSTLAAMLCRDEQIKGIFKDKILFVTVSKTPILKILSRLLEVLGGGVPESDLSEEDATKKFQFLLKQRKSEPLLLVLDDVWEEPIITKLSSITEGYKMLVTSREAFAIYNYKHHSKYHLKTLNPQDSMTLFRETALLDDYEPDMDLLNEIVRCCDGFPLAIVVIARALSRQPAGKWRNTARRLSKGAGILDFDEKVRECLVASLEFLDDDTLLECFLDLCSFPEDKRIPASVLIDIWSELYDLEYEDDAFVNLLELASRNLVNFVGSRKIAEEGDASFNELFVTQHDLLRDLAVYQSRQAKHQGKRLIMDKREEGLPESWRGQENHYLNARLVSLCTGEMCMESWYDMQLPEGEVLILNLSASNYFLPPFMGKMRKLKVLIVANRGRTNATLSNLTKLSELANLKRIRLEKVLIPSLHEFTMPLTNLQKISLVMCGFGQALMKCTINVSNVLPNLVEINIDYCDGLVELPSWICDISNLQTLSITNCDNLRALPERIGYITELDLLRLHACTGLSKLPDSIKELQKLRFVDISDCCNLKKLPDVIGKLHRLKKLDMRGCIDISELPPSAMNLVHHLNEVICDEVHVNLWKDLSSSLKITVPKKDINLDWLGVDI